MGNNYKIIPLDNSPDQSFLTTVSVDGNNLKLKLRLRFNTTSNYWVMSITDPKTGNLLIDNIPLLTGGYPAADLLGQYKYLGLGSAMIINAGNSSLDSPDENSFANGDFLLAWGDTI